MDASRDSGASAASLTDKPLAGQYIQHDGNTYTTIQEGLAFILIPPDTPLLTDPKAAKNGTLPPAQNVFYNPIQQFNRDLTVLAIRAFGEAYISDTSKTLQTRRQRARKRQKHVHIPEENGEAAGIGSAAALSTKRGREESPSGKPVETFDVKGVYARDRDVLMTEDEDDRPSKRPKLGHLDGKASNAAKEEGTAGPIDAEDIPDEDLIACESSIPSSTIQISHDQAAKSHENTRENIPSGQPEVKFNILDALSASGLRALRYAQELPFVTSVTANDLSPKAVQAIKLNIKHNQLADKVNASTGNANAHMYQSIASEGSFNPGRQYTVIDLDPYGTAVPFLDAAVQAIADGGLLCVTCTDTAVFNSVGYLEKAFALYGGLPSKGPHVHEGGLRLILHAITTAAARYGRSVEPLLSLSIDYYARVFVRIRRSPNEVKLLAGKTMIVYGCDAGCGAWRTQFIARNSKQQAKNNATFYKFTAAQGPTSSPHCEHCGSKTHVSGPMYGGPLHNPFFIERMLSHLSNMDDKIYGTKERLQGMLSTALEETELYESTKPADGMKPSGGIDADSVQRLDPAMVDNHPFYVVPSALSRVVHCQAPSMAQLRGALRYRGYRATASHAKPGTIKTDAPWSVIWKVMLEWIRQHSPIHPERVKEGMAGWKILQGLDSLAEAENKATDTARKDGETTIVTDTAASTEQKTSESDTAEEKPWVVFDEKLGVDKARGKLVRYQANPRANWGPMARAKGVP